ncbi:hypothetical protein [Marinobacter sp. NSM]|uniref:hypothetical protein n=1 Tax=Marinobacter sp. NSM TaxID=3458004 RepID=UPI0040368BB2
MNIELKPIAQKKLDQMGATVHGVLVKNEAGAWAAVSEAGRVMWLDDFEDQGGEYAAYLEGMNSHLKAEPEAARTQSGQEVMGWVMPSAMKNDGLNFTADKKLAESWMKFSSEVTPVYIRPAQQDPDLQLIHERDHWEEKATELAEDVGKLLGVEVGEHSSANCPVQNAIDAVFRATEYPAQQGSVPDYVNEALQRLIENGGNLGPASREDALVVAQYRRELLATPQPEGDGWTKCSERLPTDADSDCEGCVWVSDGDLVYTGYFGHVEAVSDHYWKPTGLKRPQPPSKEGG